MKNFHSPGRVVSITAPTGGIVSGEGVLIGDALFGIATGTAEAGTPAEILTEGVVEIAKLSALAIEPGDRLYWDDVSGWVNATALGNLLVGVAVAGAANPSPTVLMRLGAPGSTA